MLACSYIQGHHSHVRIYNERHFRATAKLAVLGCSYIQAVDFRVNTVLTKKLANIDQEQEVEQDKQ